ncbi:hypothetical protein DFH29DRAFT_1002734 [Suillus ampliporus]|nr:hypothetical protein DFH29DRAFT_1002734 [Suillus ampliporus]
MKFRRSWIIAQLPHPKLKPPSIPPQSTTPPPQCNVPLKRKSTAPAPRVDYQTWEHNTISTVLKVALSAELESEGYLHMTLTIDIMDHLLITRLELNAQATMKHSLADVDSSNVSLRGTLKSLQSSLFQIFNTLYYVPLNVKRAGMQVELDNVASDSFMVNLQSVLLRFAELFMDTR